MTLPSVECFQILETTLYTSDQNVVLLDAHLSRMKGSSLQLQQAYGRADIFPFGISRTAVVQRISDMCQNPGPYRIRMLLNYLGHLDIQAIPIKDTCQCPPALVLDTQATDTDSVFVRCKTTYRQLYTEAVDRLPSEYRDAQVLLYNERGQITEGNIANVAVGIPQLSGEYQLVTPPAEAGLLAGTMRSHLIKTQEVIEDAISVEQFRRAVQLGYPVWCMNSVRGMYQANPVILD